MLVGKEMCPEGVSVCHSAAPVPTPVPASVPASVPTPVPVPASVPTPVPTPVPVSDTAIRKMIRETDSDSYEKSFSIVSNRSKSLSPKQTIYTCVMLSSVCRKSSTVLSAITQASWNG